MPYCENCGNELTSTSKFCGRCGSRVNVETQVNHAVSLAPVGAAPLPAAQVGNAAKSEPVLGVLVLRKPKSLGRYDRFSGVLSNQRLIFAQMTEDMLKDAIKQAREQAKAEGKGFFGQWGEQLKASAAYSSRYLDMSPSEVLSETLGNFAVSNSAVSEVKLKLKDTGNQANLREFEIEVKSSSGKYEFRMEENSDYVKVLKQVYGDRVKIPMGYFGGGLKFKIG